MIKDIIAAGIGFDPGSTKWVVTRGFGQLVAETVIVQEPPRNSMNTQTGSAGGFLVWPGDGLRAKKRRKRREDEEMVVMM